MHDPDWEADLRRYGPKALRREQAAWAVRVYRYGRWADRLPAGWPRRVHQALYWPLFRLVETVTGISLPKTVQIGPGLRIWHFGGIFVHRDVRIGANCTMRQGVTLGNRRADDDVPVLGDDVELGAYAQVLGRIRIGHGARIGAMSVVLSDVPDGATAIGNPARIVMPRSADAPPQDVAVEG